MRSARNFSNDEMSMILSSTGFEQSMVKVTAFFFAAVFFTFGTTVATLVAIWAADLQKKKRQRGKGGGLSVSRHPTNASRTPRKAPPGPADKKKRANRCPRTPAAHLGPRKRTTAPRLPELG